MRRVFFLLPLLVPIACSSDGEDGKCDPAAIEHASVVRDAALALVSTAAEVRANVALACHGIASDLGGSPPAIDGANTSDEDLSAACDAASSAVSTAIAAEPSFALQLIGGRCTVKAETQLSCEASCLADPTCDLGTLTDRCDPDELSGTCAAECAGSCTVETGFVGCDGGCTGTCRGTCMGTCDTLDANGDCDGRCEGICNGACTGTCEIVQAGVPCPGVCSVGCSVPFTAPACEGRLASTNCVGDPACMTGCAGLGTLGANCTPPTMVVEASASLAATLEIHLPVLFLARDTQGPLFLDVAADVANSAANVVAQLRADAACLENADALIADLEAAAPAAQSLGHSLGAGLEMSVGL